MQKCDHIQTLFMEHHRDLLLEQYICIQSPFIAGRNSHYRWTKERRRGRVRQECGDRPRGMARAGLHFAQDKFILFQSLQTPTNIGKVQPNKLIPRRVPSFNSEPLRPNYCPLTSEAVARVEGGWERNSHPHLQPLFPSIRPSLPIAADIPHTTAAGEMGRAGRAGPNF